MELHKMTPKYNTMTFAELFDNAEKFIQEYRGNGISPLISDVNATTLYYLLYAKYGNSPIANADLNQAKYKIWSIIYMYGPTWEKELEIQRKVRELTDEEMLQGSKTIMNHAFNPSGEPSTATLTELEKIDEQNSNNYKRGKLEGYQAVLSLLKTDVTAFFLSKFKIVFKQFVIAENPTVYITEGEEDD